MPAAALIVFVHLATSAVETLVLSSSTATDRLLMLPGALSMTDFTSSTAHSVLVSVLL